MSWLLLSFFGKSGDVFLNAIALSLRVSTILFRINRLSQRFQVLPPAPLFRRGASPGLRWRVCLHAAVYNPLPPAAAVPASFVPGAFSRFYFPTSHFLLSFTPLPLATRCSLLIHRRRSRHERNQTGSTAASTPGQNGSHVKSLSRSRCYLPPDICLRRRGPGGNQRGCDMEGKRWRRAAKKRNTLEFPQMLWWKCKCVPHDGNLRRAHKVRSDHSTWSYTIKKKKDFCPPVLVLNS